MSDKTKCVLLFLFLLLVYVLLVVWHVFLSPSVEDLLVDESAFPAGWHISENVPRPIPLAPCSCPTGVAENTDLHFYSSGAGASERIWRYRTVHAASRGFDQRVRSVFRENEFHSPWVWPDELAYQSSAANRYRIGCSISKGQVLPGCAYVAQYGPYVIHFQAGISPNVMSYADFIHVLEAIDERME